MAFHWETRTTLTHFLNAYLPQSLSNAKHIPTENILHEEVYALWASKEKLYDN